MSLPDSATLSSALEIPSVRNRAGSIVFSPYLWACLFIPAFCRVSCYLSMIFWCFLKPVRVG